MKYTSKYISFMLLLFLTGGLLHSCLNTVQIARMCAVTVTVDADRTASLRIEPLTLAKKVELLAERWMKPNEAYAYIPSIIENIRVTVTAGDMETAMATENVVGLDQASITLEVPVGLKRNFLVEALSAVNVSVWYGQKSDVDLTGTALTVPITMVPGTVTVPDVTGTDPADGAVDVPLLTAVTASFSESMDTRTITDSSFTLVETRSGQQVAGTVSASGQIATFTPGATLVPNRDYRATITTAVRSAYGIPLAHDAVWIFTTVPTTPTVIATSPANGQGSVPINAIITAAFSEEMLASSITTSTFLLSGTTGSVIYNAAGRTATFTPAGTLSSNTTYTATITNGAQSALGMPLLQDHVWSFMTSNTTDTTPPVFSGIGTVTTLSLTSAQLTWTTATDNVTPSANIVYLVYVSSTPGVYGPDPLAVTAPGATSFTVNGLTPGVTYYFRVHARDEAGNEDANIAELSILSTCCFVDAVSGVDTNIGSEASPFKTITRALEVITMSNTVPMGIYAAAGTYSAPDESFPLQLAPLTSLFCRGPALTTVIDATGSGADAIYGNDSTSVDRCRIVPETGRSAIDDRLGGSGGTAYQIAVSDSEIDGPSSEAVVFSAASSLVTSTVTGTTGTGVSILAGRPSIDGNTIRGKQVGIEVAADTDPSIDGNVIENNGVGIEVTAAGGRPSVRNNIISNNAVGVLVTAGAPLIHKNEVRTNTISGNDVGIEIAGGMPTISFNTVTNNNKGVNVSGGTPSIKSNEIFCNDTADLNIEINNVIDAKINAWDHAPPVVLLAPCVLGTDICYKDAAGVPTFTPYSSVPVGACP